VVCRQRYCKSFDGLLLVNEVVVYPMMPASVVLVPRVSITTDSIESKELMEPLNSLRVPHAIVRVLYTLTIEKGLAYRIVNAVSVLNLKKRDANSLSGMKI
jgi:hypothetical protein